MSSRVTRHGLDASWQPVPTSAIDEPAAHAHVPLLLSPYAYSTCRGR